MGGKCRSELSSLYANDLLVTAKGRLVLGDRGNYIVSYDLDEGDVTARSTNVLGFEPSLVCQESTVPGNLTLLGTGKFLAASTALYTS